uniref:Eukaryotic translation initiation factor 3 subunit H n=1 Tax=Panagrellus redivivus TaxID=6233 RepID=A0A7E4ZZW6_PANRE
MAEKFLLNEAKVKSVQLDALVVMKIVKHVDSEFYSGMSDVAGETCAGILTGLIATDDHRLEVTNCFPTPRAEVIIEGEEYGQGVSQSDEGKHTEITDMLKRFRDMNIDYELVGFYQAHKFGACFTQEVIDSLVDYQTIFQDGVVIVYDPVRTRQGQLSLRAFRLTNKALELSLSGDWSPETVKNAGLTHETMLEELPIVIRNSHLINVLLSQLSIVRPNKAAPHLELGTGRSMEKCIRSLLGNVDELNKSVGAYNKYVSEKQRYDAICNSLVQKRQAENEQRIARGEPPLSVDEIKRNMKTPQLMTRGGMLDIFLNASNANAFADYATEITKENLAKLFISEAVADSVGDA